MLRSSVRIPPAFVSACASLALAAGLALPARGQEETAAGSGDGFHLFRDKTEKSVEAKILSIAPDLKKMKMELRGGQVFDYEITLLSLDDQQYVKDWMKTQSTKPVDYRLEVGATRLQGETDRYDPPSDTYGLKLVTVPIYYNFTIENQGREPVFGLKLEYAILRSDQVYFDTNTETGEKYYLTRAEPAVAYDSGSLEVPPLEYNREVDLPTPFSPEESARGEGNQVYYEDKLIGVLYRVVDPQGNTIVSDSRVDRRYAHVTWEYLDAHRDPNESEGSGLLAPP